MKSSKSKANSLDQRIKEKIAAIAVISNDLPSIIIIHNLHTRTVEYMSERGLKILKTSMQELKKLGPAYFDQFFNPEDAPNYVPKFITLLEKNDPEEVFTFFQQVRANGDEEWGWYLSASKVIMCDDEGKPYLSLTSAHPIDSLKSITYKLERLLNEKNLMRKELSNYTLLTKREREVITLLVTGHSSSSVAAKLFISSHTVEQHRKNIKNKLGIKNLPEMVLFAQAFDMRGIE